MLSLLKKKLVRPFLALSDQLRQSQQVFSDQLQQWQQVIGNQLQQWQREIGSLAVTVRALRREVEDLKAWLNDAKQHT